MARSGSCSAAIFASTALSPSTLATFSSWARSLIAARSSSENPLNVLPVAVVLLADFSVAFFGLIETSSYAVAPLLPVHQFHSSKAEKPQTCPAAVPRRALKSSKIPRVKGQLLLRCNVDHPLHAELVRTHPEGVSPGGLLERHRDPPSGGELIEVGCECGLIVTTEGQADARVCGGTVEGSGECRMETLLHKAEEGTE